MSAILDKIVGLWATEPLVITGAITAILDGLVVFGVQISDEQKTAIVTIVSTLGVLIARSQVFSPKSVAEAAVAAAAVEPAVGVGQ